MMPSEVFAPAEQPAVPLSRVAGFIRQVTHDVRNTLNSLDLQAAYLLELSTDAEALEELRRMRAIIQTSARQLQNLSANFWTSTPNLVPYSASILIEDLEQRLSKVHPEEAPRIDWGVRLGEEAVEVDIEMLYGALMRILENAFAFSPAGERIGADVYAESGRLIFEFQQASSPPSSDPARWGVEPFVTTRRGAYGLGLFRARGFLAVHDGDLAFEYDSGRNLLLTRVSIPFAPSHEFSAAPPTDRHY